VGRRRRRHLASGILEFPQKTKNLRKEKALTVKKYLESEAVLTQIHRYRALTLGITSLSLSGGYTILYRRMTASSHSTSHMSRATIDSRS